MYAHVGYWWALFVDARFSYALHLMWEDRTHVPMWSQMLTAYSTRGSTPCAMKICIIRCKYVEDSVVLLFKLCLQHKFCKRNFRTPTWVNNVIGMHESCLGQLPWDVFIGRVFFTEGFLSSGYQLGFSAWLISHEFFPHTCNNSSKVVKGVLVKLFLGSQC